MGYGRATWPCLPQFVGEEEKLRLLIQKLLARIRLQTSSLPMFDDLLHRDTFSSWKCYHIIIEENNGTINMCGRYILGESSWAEYHDALSIINPQVIKPRFNIAPTQSAPICYASSNTLISTDARWWYVPGWHKGDVKGTVRGKL